MKKKLALKGDKEPTTVEEGPTEEENLEKGV